MKVQVTQYRPGVPDKSFYRQGTDYLLHEFDLEFADVLRLLRELKGHRNQIEVDAPSAWLNFYIEADGSLWVEIYGRNWLWAVSEIDPGDAEEILKTACQGGDFGEQLPQTNRTWDAYSGI